MKKDLKVYFSLVMLAILILTGCKERTETSPQGNIPVSDTALSSVVLDLQALKEQGQMPDVLKVEIKYDHFFKTTKDYRAYSLITLIDPYLRKLQIDKNAESDAVVTFFCTDGYKPTLALRALLAQDGYIAFREEGLSDRDEFWPDSLKEKFPPFYLVWQNVPYEEETLPWPYGLYKIKIDKANTVYDAIIPSRNEEAMAGFNQFRSHCIKCHSVNKVGGNVGPDFNYPKNITDYWEVENMWNYAKNPQSFRYNARMIPITSLTREEFDEIIVYLRYIRSTKSSPDTSGKQ